MFDRIQYNPRVLRGRACIRDIRMSVAQVINLIANGRSQEDIMAEYPDLEPEDISQALQYASFLASEETYPIKASVG